MDSRQRVMKVLCHEIPDRVPLFEVLIDGRIAERVIGVCKDSWTLSPGETVKLGRALGQDSLCVALRSWKDPRMKGSKPDIDDLKPPSMAEVEASVDRCDEVARCAHDEGICVSAYVHGAFDVVYESLGFENFMFLLYDDFGYVDALTEKFYLYHKTIAEMAVNTDIDYLLVGDDISFKTGLFINPGMFLKLWYEREKNLVQVSKKAGKPVEFHTDGRLDAVIPYLMDIGVDLVNPAEPYSNDILELKKTYGDKIALRGNLDMGLLSRGTREEVHSAAKALILGMKPGGNYVCSSSHSVSLDVKLDNYMEVVRAVDEYGRY